MRHSPGDEARLPDLGQRGKLRLGCGECQDVHVDMWNAKKLSFTGFRQWPLSIARLSIRLAMRPQGGQKVAVSHSLRLDLRMALSLS